MDGPRRRAIVDDDEDGATLAAVVRGLMDELPWSKSRELVRSGKVRVEGELHFDPAARLRAGTLVEVDPAARRRRAPSLAADRLVHVDAHVVVVRQPAGLLSVPWDEHDQRDTLIERTRLALRERDGAPRRAGERDRLGIVQRLDKDTTGLLVFARSRRAREGLEAQFRAHRVERRYLALVRGRAEAAVYDTHLVADRGDWLRGSWRGARPPKAARRAITKVRVEAELAGDEHGEATLISCRLETGRQHQIRIHLAEAGHPLLGETVYGHSRRRGQPRNPSGDTAGDAPRPMLHAASLAFRHPIHDRPLRFEDPPPDDFRALLERLRG